ncbi:MAG: hypothetical protein ACRED1_12450, partial [Limisphaerales bacterium]
MIAPDAAGKARAFFARAVHGMLPVQKRRLKWGWGKGLAAGAWLLAVGTVSVGAQIKLTVQPGVQLTWFENTTNSYQLQRSASSSAWVSLEESPGDGLTNTYFDPSGMSARGYEVLDIVPGTPATSALPANGGFENGSGGNATDWLLDTAAGGPVYGIRTNDNPHSGSYNFEIHLASTGTGPVVELNQTGIPVTGGTVYPFTFVADALTGSAGYNGQWRVLWNTGGDTGYQTFTPGNNSYAIISNSVTAPAGATSATIYFHFAGAASASQSATLDLDDVVLGSGAASPGTPAVTNVLPVAVQPVACISWPTASGAHYQPEFTTRLSAETWMTNFPVIIGDGGIDSFMISMTNDAGFFRLQIPPIVVMP